MDRSNVSLKTKILMFMLMLFVELLLGAFLLSREFIIQEVNDELKMTAQFLGDGAANAYHDSANETYEMLFIDTEIAAHTYYLWIPNTNKPQAGLEGMGQEAFDVFESKLDNMWNIVFKGVLRFTLFISWVPFFLPLFIPGVINGLMIREVKKLNYGYASPVRFNCAYQIILSTFVVVPIYLLFPVAIHPIVIPIWLAVCSVSALIMFANLQKMI